MVIAPCGFPLSLLSGISAIVVGGQARRAALENGTDGESQARAAILTGWIGLALNFVIMLLKLAMFIGLIALPLLAIWQGTRSK